MQAGMRVKIVTKDRLHFSGIVISSDEHFLEIKDKFNHYVAIGKDNISVLEEVE